ncbi:hypothetical protein RHSIM_Rhsim04G0194800 [Rhododendron simsii]|uniref:Uncharacterized protein n=1 Tax=Rhododendron simsii TaxID=118357 RepID=A0A834H0I0_RHOSS|nr:hypothetical protein RHSIM_Rhsim04G0194800 [Rhododendron simsii]
MTQNYWPKPPKVEICICWGKFICRRHSKSDMGTTREGPISTMITKSLHWLGSTPELMTESVVGRVLAKALLCRPCSPNQPTPPKKFKPRPSRLSVVSGA